LIKSALVASIARGHRHGLDRASAREPLAAQFYDVTHTVPAGLHAIERNRRLAGAALGYVPGPRCDYGLRTADGALPGRCLPDSPAYALLLTMTSRKDKLWPEERWRALGGWLKERGVSCLLPWGSAEERSRCERIAAAIPGASVPERMSLTEFARLSRGARVAVGLDTGLTHLAAALGIPSLGLFCASSPALTGLQGGDRVRNLGAAAMPPEVKDVQEALAGLLGQP
jgi:heptosyltransferase-1